VAIKIRNSRPQRLRSRLRELETVLQTQKVIWCRWRTESCLQIVTSCGLIISIKTHFLTCSPLAVSFDRFLIGKTAEITDGTWLSVVFKSATLSFNLIIVRALKELWLGV